MFARAQRLSRADFPTLYKRGRRASTQGLSLVYTPAPEFKAAVVVGKKVAKSAGARNRLKRRWRALLREAHIGRGYIIVTAAPAAAAYSYAALREALTAALRQARIGSGSASR